MRDLLLLELFSDEWYQALKGCGTLHVVIVIVRYKKEVVDLSKDETNGNETAHNYYVGEYCFKCFHDFCDLLLLFT